MSIHFQSLEINEWQQFQHINLNFNNQVTIITGANGSGKTTLLNLLARHRGWNMPSLAVPYKKDGAFNYLSRFFKGKYLSDNNVGSINYSNGIKSKLNVPSTSDLPGAQYTLDIPNIQPVSCFFVPSHRSVFRYQPISSISTNKKDKNQAFDAVYGAALSRHHGSNANPSNFHIKETLISWSIFGRGNEDMPKDDEQLKHYLSFQDILEKVLPLNISFQRFSIRRTEIVLECASGDFLLDSASGGISAIIDLAWQIHMFSTEENGSFVVVIDEVENHLHPTLQRRVLPDLLNAFPQVKFIVTTHAPLIVNSVRDADVYVLRYNEQNKVISEKLDFLGQAKTATQILDEVLGVSFTMPIWAEDALKRIVDEFSKSEINKNVINKLRKELHKNGLEEFAPQAISDLVGLANDQTH